jgi:hypothetical protein
VSGDWRAWALTAGLFLLVIGIGVWSFSGSFALMIVGALAVITSIFERAYGSPVRPPVGAGWRATDERFIDPESGQLVRVWFEPDTGERRYVADGEAPTQP